MSEIVLYRTLLAPCKLTQLEVPGIMLYLRTYTASRKLYFLKHKSETADCFLNFVKTVFTATGRHVQLLRCDGGTEYINHFLKNQSSLLGIKIQTSASYTPKQNGIAERDHRSTVEWTKSQIHTKGVLFKLWAEAINYSVYVLNRTISKSETITPYQRWFGKSSDISNLRVFGSVAYFLTPDVLRQKLYPKATKDVYVGESKEQKASRVFVEATWRTHISRHLKVYEDLPYWPVSTLAVPAPLSTNSMPLTDAATPDAGDIPAPEDQFVIPPPMVRPVSLPVRKSLRGLVLKKMFPFEITGAFVMLCFNLYSAFFTRFQVLKGTFFQFIKM
jgi:hypothetical protein